MNRVYVQNHNGIENYINQCLWYDLDVIIPKRGLINSIFVPKLQTKIIDESKCKLFYNPLDNIEMMMLPSECARIYLKHLYEPFHLSNSFASLKTPAPIFFCGKFNNRELVYFDIIGAYYQLYKRLWLDFSDYKVEFNQSLSQIANELKNWKEARNFVIGNLASNEFCRMKPDNTWQYVKNYEKDYYNPFLLYFLNSVLQEIANIALKFGACYIATDCAIFPGNQKWHEFYKFLNSRNVLFRCVRGVGSIAKFGSYSVDGECLCGEKSSVSTMTYRKMLQSKYVDNPIYANDIRVQNIVSRHNRPTCNIVKSNSTFNFDFWSKIAII